MSDCLFCKIVKKEIPSNIVFETDDVLAFRDINPKAPVHILVIPKLHIGSFAEIKQEHSALLMKMIKMIQDIAKKEGIDQSGFRIVANNGPDAGQAVAHLHFHVIGGRPLKWPPG